MSADELEMLLRRCRPPQPPAAVERRVVDAARDPRKAPSRFFALTAAVLFAAVVFSVVRSEPPRRPGGAQGTVRAWTYTCREEDRVVAALSAEEAVVAGGVARLRVFTAKLFPQKAEPITIRADRARFDPADLRLTLEGAVRIDAVDGFSAATVDLREKTWTATTDLAERFAKSTKSAPEKFRPKIEIDARSAKSWDNETTFDQCSFKLTCPGWTFVVSGPQGRSDRVTYTITGGVGATFEEGSTLKAQEARLLDSERTLRLKGTFN